MASLRFSIASSEEVIGIRWRRFSKPAMVAAAALLAVAAMGCGEGTGASLLRFEGRGYGIDSLQSILDGRPGPSNPDEARDAVDDALWTLEQQIYALSRPLDDDERLQIEKRVRWLKRVDCVNLGIKRRLAPLDFPTRAREFFEHDPSRYALPATCALQTIFIPVSTPNARRLAKDLLAEVQNDPRLFRPLAVKHSQSVSAQTGGLTPEIPVSALHPRLQAAVLAHGSSQKPFLVEIDRGSYVVRVVHFIDAVQPMYNAVAARVIQDVRNQAEEAIFAEAEKSVVANGEVKIDESKLRLPLVGPDEEVYRVGETGYTLREIARPGLRIGKGLPGPRVKQLIDQHRRLQAFAVYFGCDTAPQAEKTDVELGALRLPELVRDFTRKNLHAEVEDFVASQSKVLRAPAEIRFDLVILPFLTGDPYTELLRQKTTVEKIRGLSDISKMEATDDSSLAVPDLEFTEDQIGAYEPALVSVLRGLQPGEWSAPLSSMGLESILLVRLKERVPARECDLKVKEDFDRVLEFFLVEKRQVVDDALRREVTPLFKVNAEALARFADEYSAPAGSSAGEEEDSTDTRP